MGTVGLWVIGDTDDQLLNCYTFPSADAADVEWLYQTPDGQRIGVLGFSMGAMTALTFATRHPERVRTLIVIGITTEREPRASVARRLMDPEWIDRNDPARAGILARRHDPYQGTDAWRNLLPAISEDVRTQPLLSSRDLRGADAPALVAVGDRDPFTPVDHAWGLARTLPDGRLLVVPDCPHEVVSRRPGLFNEAAAAFYRSTEEIADDRAGR